MGTTIMTPSVPEVPKRIDATTKAKTEKPKSQKKKPQHVKRKHKAPQ